MNEYTLRGIAEDLIEGKRILLLERRVQFRNMVFEAIYERLSGHLNSRWGAELTTANGGALLVASPDARGYSHFEANTVVFSGAHNASERDHANAVALAKLTNADLIAA